MNKYPEALNKYLPATIVIDFLGLEFSSLKFIFG